MIIVTAGRPADIQLATGNVQLYPNPTTGAFTLAAEAAGILIDGREVASYGIVAGINQLNLPKELAAGIYMCKYTSESGGTTMVRLVYER